MDKIWKEGQDEAVEQRLGKRGQAESVRDRVATLPWTQAARIRLAKQKHTAKPACRAVLPPAS